MVKSATPTSTSRKPSKVEGLKERSNFLREPVATELLQDTNHFTAIKSPIAKEYNTFLNSQQLLSV